MIDAAERPVVFCGHGVVAAGAGELLRELVEKADMPGGLDAARPRRLPGERTR